MATMSSLGLMDFGYLTTREVLGLTMSTRGNWQDLARQPSQWIESMWNLPNMPCGEPMRCEHSHIHPSRSMANKRKPWVKGLRSSVPTACLGCGRAPFTRACPSGRWTPSIQNGNSSELAQRSSDEAIERSWVASDVRSQTRRRSSSSHVGKASVGSLFGL